MKSKKGALFHWIIFGLLAAIGIFAWSTYDAEIGVKVKGEWQLDFLHNYYVEMEEKLLQTDQIALYAGNKVVLTLAEKGGFAENSKCGVEDGLYYWNNRDTFCFLEVDKEVNFTFNTVSREQYGAGQSYAVSHQGSELAGKAEKDLVVSRGGTQYFLKPHFRVNLDYNFDEYFQLQKEASGLVHECKAAQELQKCLKKIMPAYWKFTDCDAGVFKESNRKVPFCVVSPNAYVIFEDGASIPVRYKFGLDFASI